MFGICSVSLGFNFYLLEKQQEEHYIACFYHTVSVFRMSL